MLMMLATLVKLITIVCLMDTQCNAISCQTLQNTNQKFNCLCHHDWVQVLILNPSDHNRKHNHNHDLDHLKDLLRDHLKDSLKDHHKDSFKDHHKELHPPKNLDLKISDQIFGGQEETMSNLQ